MKFVRQAGLLASLVLLGATTAVSSQAAKPPVTAPQAPSIAEASGGLYTNCAACHGANGQGGFGPPLRGNPNVANADYVLRMVVHGGARMPAFSGQLNDEEIARVISAVRASWGNRYPPVTAAAVAKVRAQKK